jgi:hypothetical protein
MTSPTWSYPRGRTKANRELFDAWLILAERVKGMNSIVQNDMMLSMDTLDEYEKQAGLLLLDIATLTRRTMRHLHSED